MTYQVSYFCDACKIQTNSHIVLKIFDWEKQKYPELHLCRQCAGKLSNWLKAKCDLK